MSRPIRITYFDSAMVLIETGGVRLLTDPVLDPAGKTFDHGPVHLEKTGDASVTPEQLGRIDAVLLSHEQHGDNLDDAGRAFLSRVPRVLTTPESAGRLGGVTEGLSNWQSVVVDGEGGSVTVTAVPAQHGPDGTEAMTGAVTGFVVAAGERTIYISGDTVLFSGTEQVASRYSNVDLAILHVGQAQPLPGFTVSLTAEQAIGFAKALGARKVLPVHFEGWAHFTEGRDSAMGVFAGSDVANRIVSVRRGQSIEVG
jgi:L-ascorbate metabolism protein UlaG (beta-lactamase superfamily)